MKPDRIPLIISPFLPQGSPHSRLHLLSSLLEHQPHGFASVGRWDFREKKANLPILEYMLKGILTTVLGFPGGAVVKNRLPIQGTRVRSLVREAPTCRRATKPVRHKY